MAIVGLLFVLWGSDIKGQGHQASQDSVTKYAAYNIDK